MLKAENLKLSRGKSEKNFSFEVGPNEMHFLVGPNGSGKTTLCLTLSKIIEPKEGTIHTKLNQIPYLSATSSAHSDLWCYEVADIMLSSKKEKEREQHFAQLLLIDDLKKRKIKHLSTGEKKRVLLSSVLALDTELIILDEPSTHLDWYFLLVLKDILESEQKSKKSFVISTHDFNWLLKFHSSKSWLLNESSLFASGPSSSVLESQEFKSVFNILTKVSDNFLDQTKHLLISKK